MLLCGAVATAVVTSCNGNQIGGSTDLGTGGGTDDAGSGGTGDGGNNNSDGGNLPAYCNGSGPPINVSDPSSGTSTCTGDIASTVFRYGLCVCNSFSLGAAPMTIDAFDSTMPGAMSFGTGGSAGINTNINFGSMSVGGSLFVAGSIVPNQTLSVGVDLASAAGLNSGGSVTVGRNAQINGNVIVNSGQLKVLGTLTYPNGSTLSAPSNSIGSTVRGPVTVSPPCDCAANLLYNIGGYVTARKTDNDNAAVGFDSMQLANISMDKTVTLNCGRFYLDRMDGAGKVTLQVNGRSALFVGSNVNLSGGLAVNLGASGELDLFIDGGLVSSSPITLGNPQQPARVRLYMSKNGNINLAAGSTVGGNIYAPQSALVTSGRLDVYGSIFVGQLNASNIVNIHHDVGILKAADACNKPTGTGGNPPPPPPSCNRCQDCGGQACKSGTCGSCTTTAECCSPLTCYQGTCQVYAG